MESRLAYHDDPFDGNFEDYDTESPFWSNDAGNLGLQLTETLHGILPIAPRDVGSANLFNNSILKDSEDEGHMKKELFSPLQRTENSYFDGNDDNDSDSLPITNMYENGSSYGEADSVEGDDYFNVRICSRSTFRSRTDSSSIGDYESHSSDYDDDSDSVELNGRENNFLFQSDGNEIQSFEDEADPFALQLDVNTFDLAAFITSDEHNVENSTTQVANVTQDVKMERSHLKSKPKLDSESDSDVIVDVETLENDDISFVELNPINEHKEDGIDITKCDSWSSRTNTLDKSKKKAIDSDKHIPICIKKIQCAPQKAKFDDRRGEYPVRKKPKADSKTCYTKTESSSNSNIKEVIQVSSDNLLVPDKSVKASVCKKDLSTRAHVKHLNVNEENVFPQKHRQRKKDLECDFEVFDVEPISTKRGIDSSLNQDTFPKKRKLNLTEYKKRQKNSVHDSFSENTDSLKKEDKAIRVPEQLVKPIINSSTEYQSPSKKCINSKVKPLENQLSKKFLDPITEAKNKALRVQELKKAQHIKAIDSTVSSKVARVTKLLPLEEIVKNSYKRDVDQCVVNSSKYEEIITFSVGCNTDITFAMNKSNIQQYNEMNSSKTQSKYNELLTDIRNSFQKVNSDETVNVTSNSLITSINDVVIKKVSPQPTKLVEVSTGDTTKSQLSENKIIMHLRKDRIRKRNPTQSTQTDLLPEFPILHLPKLQASNDRCSLSAHEELQERRRNGPQEKHTHPYNNKVRSPYSETEDFSKTDHRNNSARGHLTSPSRDRSRSKSSDRSHNRKSRSRTKSSMFREDFDRNVSAPAVEERRIVYVGRIEQEATKETLRRKFASYGPIKHITIRYKDTGMNYGFVTFTNSEDAFRVIDNYQKDASINMYDISFGGRRAFCRSSYADLDNAGLNVYQSYASIRQVAQPVERDSFEALLSQMKAKLQAV